MQNKFEARRRLLKNFSITGSITALTPLPPAQWSKPLINWVALPAHAQMSEPLSQNAEFEGFEYRLFFVPQNEEEYERFFTIQIEETLDQSPRFLLSEEQTTTPSAFPFLRVSSRTRSPGQNSGLRLDTLCRFGDFVLRLELHLADDNIVSTQLAADDESSGCESNPSRSADMTVTGSLGTEFNGTVTMRTNNTQVSDIVVLVSPATFIPTTE